MARPHLIHGCLLFITLACMSQDKTPEYPSVDYTSAQLHEIKPHRRTIPLKGIRQGFNQLHLTLIVSPTGDVLHADADSQSDSLKYWPQLQGEVAQWKFTPFEKDGKPITAEVEEYIDLVPPERLPKTHVVPPVLGPVSKVAITLSRSGCFGSCPAYSVDITTEGVAFNGQSFVVAYGRHTENADAEEVRKLAKRFVAADFYSMDPGYQANVTDNPGYGLSITIDGHTKEVSDYVGSWVGMPAIITNLENEVDDFARTKRWVEGAEGLVAALKAEKFDFNTYAAQVMLKESLARGNTDTSSEFLQAGVPLKPFPAPPPPKEAYMRPAFENVGWLNAASPHLETLQLLINASASKNDQADKDLALSNAASSGNLASVRALIGYGANPIADLSKLIQTEHSGGMTMQGTGAGSILISAAASGNPDLMREILSYHPQLEARDREGKTALFAAAEYRGSVEDRSRVECVRLLVQAGADINARDNRGNTVLHETFLTPVEAELLKLGANVNARNNDGETPIFTNVDLDCFSLFIEHGADLTVRNNKGETVLEAAGEEGSRPEALRKAIRETATSKKSGANP